MRRSTFTLVLPAVLVAASCGCQREPTFEYGAVSGKVTKNGAPLPGIRIVFYADLESGTRGPRAFARTDAAGEYHLRTDAGKDGAVLGTHRVCLTESGKAPAFIAQRFAKDPGKLEKLAAKFPQGDSQSTGAESVPYSYSQIAETPLRATVHPGSQTIDFQVR
jgi:hypothetical protein